MDEPIEIGMSKKEIKECRARYAERRATVGNVFDLIDKNKDEPIPEDFEEFSLFEDD